MEPHEYDFLLKAYNYVNTDQRKELQNLIFKAATNLSKQLTLDSTLLDSKLKDYYQPKVS